MIGRGMEEENHEQGEMHLTDSWLNAVSRLLGNSDKIKKENLGMEKRESHVRGEIRAHVTKCIYN